MKIIITTVGTSLFTNCVPKDGVFKDLKKTRYSDWENNATDIDTLAKNIRNTPKYKEDDVCAEVQSIRAIQNAITDQEIMVCLVATDTVLSALASQLIQEILVDEVQFYKEKGKEEHNFPIISDLIIDNGKLFEKSGLISLFKKMNGLKNEYSSDNCILNITGGYKGLIPFTTIFSQINRIPSYYLYEDTEYLINIPQAPINLDWNFMRLNSKYFDTYSAGMEIPLLDWEKSISEYDFPQEMLSYIDQVEENGNITVFLNFLGEIVWEEFKEYFFVKIPMTCRYFKEDPNEKRFADIAICELQRRLSLVDNFNTLINSDIKHVAIDDTFVFKVSNPQQIRLQYRFDGKQITVFNYRFIKCTADDKDPKTGYEPVMKREYPNLKGIECQYIGFKKKSM
jgi:CRISPR/Cas system-associated protein Csm6